MGMDDNMGYSLIVGGRYHAAYFTAVSSPLGVDYNAAIIVLSFDLLAYAEIFCPESLCAA